MRFVSTKPIVLVGYRGTGKSTVGRRLADRLGLDFLDADEELERRAGTTIATIFATEGEQGFRNRESALLADLLTNTGVVLATGGGVVLRPANRERLKASAGFVAWLKAPAEVLWERISVDPFSGGRRPNLTAAGGLPEVRELLARREPLYREVADAVFSTECDAPDAVAAAILARLHSTEPKP